MREKFPSFDSFYNRKVNGTSGKTHVVPIYRSSGNFQSQRAVFQFAMRQWPPRYHPRRHGIASRRESSRANLEDRPFEEAIDGTTIETRYWERRDRRSIQLDCCCIYQPRSVTLRVHRLLITNFVNFFSLLSKRISQRIHETSSMNSFVRRYGDWRWWKILELYIKCWKFKLNLYRWNSRNLGLYKNRIQQ